MKLPPPACSTKDAQKPFDPYRSTLASLWGRLMTPLYLLKRRNNCWRKPLGGYQSLCGVTNNGAVNRIINVASVLAGTHCTARRRLKFLVLFPTDSVQERSKFLAMRGQGFDRHLFGLYLMAKHLKLDPFPAFLNGNVSGDQQTLAPYTVYSEYVDICNNAFWHSTTRAVGQCTRTLHHILLLCAVQLSLLNPCRLLHSGSPPRKLPRGRQATGVRTNVQREVALALSWRMAMACPTSSSEKTGVRTTLDLLCIAKYVVRLDCKWSKCRKFEFDCKP